MPKFLIITFSLLVLFCSVIFAQDIKATTEDGKSVILSSDGTWRYAKSSQIEARDQSGNFEKSSSATASLNLKGDRIFLWYDSTIWVRKQSTDPSKFQLTHKDGDIYAVIIGERFTTNIEALRNLAVDNVLKMAPDLNVTMEDDRVVNGTTVHSITSEGTISGAKFTFFGYYYTGAEGTVQVLVLMPSNLVGQYRQQTIALLNGLEVKK
jgi:hypothetical protein